MRVIRATSLGLCFGVRDALKATTQLAEPNSIALYGELVHNPIVQISLASQGFTIVNESERHELPAADRVLVTAHGISDRRRTWLEAAGKRLIDSTCPLVKRVHRAAQELQNNGYFVVLIGRPGHVEVQGIVEDLTRFAVAQSTADAGPFDSDRIGVVCQTTTPPRLAKHVYRAIVRCNPNAEVRMIDTICQPTRDRQSAVAELVDRVPALVVVGGRNSNNTRELAAIARERGVRVHHVESAADLDPIWFAGLETVGLTAGTSTLDETIDEVQRVLEAF